VGEVVNMGKKRNPFMDSIVNMKQIENEVYPDDEWLVYGLIPRGLTLFSGECKIGKSFLMLQLSIAVASDGLFLGNYNVNPGKVLYITWEDGVQRIQGRTRKAGEGFPANMFINIKPDINGKDISWLYSWLDEHPDTRLVVLDTLAYLRLKNTSNADAYIKDVTFMRPFHKITDERKFSIIGVTHTNQNTKVIDSYHHIQGSNGQPGTADNIISLVRSSRGGDKGKLTVGGRDMSELVLKLHFDEDTCVWSSTNKDISVANKILAFLQLSTVPWLTPALIAEGIGAKNIKPQLKFLLDKGLVEKRDGGYYRYLTPP
jgi:hypothetical protein